MRSGLRRRVAATLTTAAIAIAWTVVADEAPSPAPALGVASAPTELRLALLRDSWSNAAASRDRAPDLYAALQQSASYTAADDFVYALVRFQQNQYDEAIAAFDKALDRKSDDLMFLKARIWVALARKQYEPAWPAMKRYQELLFAEAKAPKRPAEARTEDLRFLGQVHGYLADAAERLNDREPTVELRDAVAANLPADELRIFEAAERETLEKYESLVADRDRAMEEFTAAADEAATAKLAEFDEKRRQLKEQRAEMEPERVKVVDAANAEMNQLVNTRAQAQQTAAALSAQIGPLRNQYSETLEQVENVRRSLALIDIRQNQGNNILFQELNAAQQRVAAIEAQLQIAERQFAQVTSALANLNRELVVKESSHRQKVGQVERELRRIDDELKKLDKDEDREFSKNPGPSNAVRLVGQKIGALENYVDYDLEVPRMRLIEILERK